MGSVGGQRLTSVYKLPEFGKTPTEQECLDLFANIDMMMRCTRFEPDGSVETVNILHASVDPGPARAQLEMMGKFMESRDFTVSIDSMPADWHRADVLVFGTDEKLLPKLGDVTDIVTYRNGLVESWDVLLYGIGSRLTTKAMPPESPVCSGPAFGLDGIGVLHGHIMLRSDMRFWEGFFAHMANELETYIDRIVSSPGKDLNDKIIRLESDFKEAGLYGDDAKLVVAAAHLLRSLRNAHAHSQRNLSAEERKKSIASIDNRFRIFGDAASAKRPSLLLGIDSYAESRHGRYKYYTRVALITRRWLYDLSKLVERNPTQGR